MIPATFEYHPASSVDEAIALLSQYGDDAKLLAGGHSLIPTMKLRLAQPAHLIDIGRIPGLSYIREEGNVVAVGALTTYATIERSEVLRRHFALLPECASVIGDPQVRNRGTIGGSISHADPSADMPGAVRALKAEIRVRGPNGERTVAADDFFLGTFTTALEPGEMVTEIRFPLPPARTGSAYTKLANKASHYAVAGCAAVVTLGADGACTAASVVITGAGTMPTRASAVEAALVGKQLDEATVAEAASHAAEGLELMEDIHGSKQYRAQMAAVMARRAILKAAERARG
ncbi:MAG: xanthine dehydrogenase family protein subunit M [Thermogemmatispora sp.]|jgi:carbon-monoxide dehydrogenase medium subunit|uniref:FAD binding domain-containing protein n=1 Tax=Thermogemmatispora sp. TaxID=1968838 RepID=UPI0019FACC73|nr:xanthine dehydrogenase family protein subunit M [Thermogemmatispora sp.]MBE3564651.1 xanthine dehydrogenase family protein subunit M [Thermogemmatispora sp.]